MSRLDSLQVALDSWCVPYLFFHPHQDHKKKTDQVGFFLVTPCRSRYLIRFGGAFCRVRKEWAEPKPNRLGSAGAWSCCLQDEWPEMDGGWNSSPISAFKAASSWHGTPKCLQEHGKSGNLCFYNWVIGCVWKWRMAFIHGRKQGKMIKHRGTKGRPWRQRVQEGFLELPGDPAAPNEAPVTGAPRMSVNSFRSPCRLDTPAPAQDLWQRWPVPQRCVDGAPHCTTSQIWIWVLGSGGPQIDSPWLVVEGEP